MSRFPTVEVSDPALEMGGLRHVTVFSPALGRRADVTVWAPPTRGELPLVTLLHGVFGSHWAWAMKGAAHRTAARLVAAGEIRPVALAMPSDGLFHQGSGYVAHRHADYEAWVVDEVPEAAAEAVGMGGGRALVGLSMGGYGALRLGARHGDRHAAAVGMSSITRFDDLRRFVGDEVEHPSDVGDRDVIDAVLAHRERLPALAFHCGTDDDLIEANRTLHAELDVAGVAHEYAEHPGGHDWIYWSKHLAEALRFVDRALSRW